jgi:hypothetical protein
MPAAELSRLRLQINQLVLIFNQPDEFCRRLRDIYGLYGNHAYRAGQAVLPQSLLPSYRVPALVTRTLELELSQPCRENPRLALPLLDALWKDSHLEPRMLAAVLLGTLPVAEVGDEVVEKLREWGKPEENLRIFNLLAERGTVRLRRESPDRLIRLVEEWLSSPSSNQQAVGLRALVPMINDTAFENLPVIFRLLAPGVQSASPALQVDLMAALQALIGRSPVETAFFLRQALSLAENQNTARLVRRCLPAFPPSQQSGLRTALEAK